MCVQIPKEKAEAGSEEVRVRIREAAAEEERRTVSLRESKRGGGWSEI